MKCVLCCKEKMDREIFILKEKNICRSCADMIYNIRKMDMKNTGVQENVNNTVNEDIPVPKEIKKQLDEYVVGQENSKMVLSVAAYNHHKRINLKDESIKKSNIMLIGPTGCGKTYLVEILAKILNVPLARVATTNLTEAGYVGNDVESIIRTLLVRAKGDVEKAEHGIVFIDEIDKLSSKKERKDVGNVGVQQALLPILEGTDVEVVPPNESSENIMRNLSSKVTINTTNILFICGGAFPDMATIIENRLGIKENQIGFSSEVKTNELQDILSFVTTEDLKEFGMIPEFLGRFPVITTLKPLDVDALTKILYEPKDSLVEQYTKLLAYDNINIKFEEQALKMIAQKAYDIGTGARGLRAIMEKILLNLMYNAQSDGKPCVWIDNTFIKNAVE